MISRIIRVCAANPVMTLLCVCFLVFITFFSLQKLPLDALPDLTDTQVIVSADWQGRAPDLIENSLTYPLVTSLLATPKVRYVRGLSMFGTSQVTVVFEDGTDLYWARSRIAEKLTSVANLPQGVSPALGPEATGLGWVYQYAVVDKTGKLDLSQLRSLQDWNLRFALQAVPGVAEIASIGGFVKQYQVNLDPVKLQAFDISPLQVTRALRNGNQEIGANVIELGGTEFVVRGRGYIKSLDEIRVIPISVSGKGRVVTVGDLGRIEIGGASRVGVAELDGEGEAVGGVVVMRIGENALNVINAVKARLEEVKKNLPAGVEIVPVYDRSSLIERAIETLKKVLFEEMLVVSIIISLFLWHVRSSWVAILPLPIAVLLSFLPMMFTNFTANIMSLGGIALAIGAMVDSGIILVENAHKHLEGRDTKTMSEAERRSIITEAMVEVGKPLFFSLLVITVSFLPIFALEGREGHLFKPLAFTKTISMAWAAVLAITLTPALGVLLLKGKFVSEDHHFISRFLQKTYTPIINFVLQYKKSVVATAIVLIVATIPVFLKIPSEFMPPLNEGSILYMPTSVAGMSIDTAIQTLQKQDALIKTLPEIERVFGKAGRTNSSTDPAPLNMFETVITLKPKEQWRSGMTQDKIIAELNAKIDFPGMPNIWWQPIQTRIEMLSTGVRTAVGVKVLGNDIHQIEEAGISIENALKQMPETRSAFAERTASGSFIDLSIKREIAALYGLNISDVQSVLDVAIGGNIPTTVVEGRERYGIQVRYARNFRDNISALNEVVIPTPTGTHVKLSQIAEIKMASGPPMIASENGKILSFVFVDVAPDVGLSQYVNQAQKIVADKVVLPPGVRLVWSGQFEALESAKKTMLVVIPVALFLIVLLLYLNTKSAVETGIVIMAVPFSLIGAFWLMWILNYKLSVASWVGILALAGLDAETGVVMLLYLTRSYAFNLKREGIASARMLCQSIHEGAVQRIRPKLMTVAAALIGLLPVMWSTGTGSEIMKRIAAPMVGGVLTSGLLELLVYPALFALWKEREIKTNLLQ